ncbi:MAG: radical SAM protein [Candidatus Omnitrophica bacterium]|nr:radical SAM protein [Candidatus Omnitrophota bacterium]
MDKKFRYVYGPIQSWRMGKSLGIDPLSDKAKICNLNCVYCQLGKTHTLTNEREEYVPTEKIVDEIKRFFDLSNPKNSSIVGNIDYLTFSGRGEPTLAKNLGKIIQAVRNIRNEEIAVITNSTLLHLPEVQKDLSLSDLVVAKLDACDESSFLKVDKAIKGVSFEKILEGIKSFRDCYQGTLAIQIMFVEENKKYAKRIADITRDINADEIQINTPLRPSAAQPLDKEGIAEIKSYFSGMPAVTIYQYERKETIPLDIEDTIKRHGNFNKN